MISKKEIITEIDKIVGLNSEVTDDTHMDLVDEISDYIEELVKKLPIHNVSNRTLNTLESIDADTKSMIDRISQNEYLMNEHDNREIRMRIDALKSVLYGR